MKIRTIRVSIIRSAVLTGPITQLICEADDPFPRSPRTLALSWWAEDGFNKVPDFYWDHIAFTLLGGHRTFRKFLATESYRFMNANTGRTLFRR